MSYNNRSTKSGYTIENLTAKITDIDFNIRNLLYDEWKEKQQEGYAGTFDEYLQYRDYI